MMLDRILANRYSLESEIGRGGMGVVYNATDLEVKRTVAVKTLPAVMSHNQDLMRRFTSEVQHASKLEHPNIVRVYDVGEDEGAHFYVMQYIDGSDLRSRMKSKGRYPVDETISIISQVADALDYAHSQGIVHRDIKPENVLLDSEGNPHVADFGIAKATEGTRTTRGMLGTPEYMSPEQVKGKSVDGRSDQYSLAVVAYEMLTGATPFKTEGDDPWAQINMHLNTPVPNPRTTVPDIPTHVANALLQALAKKPEQRFDSCEEFLRALRGEAKITLPRTQPASNRLKLFVPIFVLCLVLAVVVLISRKAQIPGAQNQSQSGPTLQLGYFVNSPLLRYYRLALPDARSVRDVVRFRALQSNDEWFDPDYSFVSDNGGAVVYYDQRGAWIIAGDGNQLDRKVRPLGFVCGISARGDKLLVVNSSGRLWLYNVADSKRVDLANGLTGGNGTYGVWDGDSVGWSFTPPSFSPDQKSVAFADASGRLGIVSADGHNPRFLTAPGTCLLQPRFDRRGEHIAYSNGRAICVVDLRSSRQTVLKADDGDRVGSFGFSGKSVAYVTGGEGDAKTAKLRIVVHGMADGKSEVVLTQQQLGGFYNDVDISPEGDLITFSCAKSVYTLSIGKSDRNLVRVGFGERPRWVVATVPNEAKHGDSRSAKGLPKGWDLMTENSADFNGDDTQETVYSAYRYGQFDQIESRVWMVRGQETLWRVQVQLLKKIRPIDVTGDGLPELVWMEEQNSGITRDVTYIYRFTGPDCRAANVSGSMSDWCGDVWYHTSKSGDQLDLAIGVYEGIGFYGWDGKQMSQRSMEKHEYSDNLLETTLRPRGYRPLF